MQKDIVLYIDAAHGISGDMLLSAFIDLGFPKNKIDKIVKDLDLPSEVIKVKRKKIDLYAGINIEYSSRIRWRTFDEFKQHLQGSKLKKQLKEKAAKMIEELFKVEALIHGEEIGMVSLHELSNIDLIIEICGVLEAINYFKPQAIYCSAINMGSGLIKTMHGDLSVPAPATLHLLRGLPVFSDGSNYELLTPTGALIARNIVDSFGKLPPVKIIKVGCGLGSANVKNNNVLRIFQCRLVKDTEEAVILMETNIDNCSSEILGNVMEKLLKEGVYDVFFVPIYMKKNRPAYKLSVLCNSKILKKVMQLIFKEIPTLGVRYWECRREILDRKIVKVETKYGIVRVKESYYSGNKCNINPEYEDCKRISIRKGIPLREVYNFILSQYNKKEDSN